MAEAPEPRGGFRFVINSVRPEAASAVAQELTRLFPLDLPNATTITQNAPIILIDSLTPQQARNVGTYALRLKALGADVQVTGQPVGKLRVLRWPLLPEIAKRPGNHVICPNCGARLKMEVFVAPTIEAPAAAPQEQAKPAAVEAAPPGPVPEPPQPEAPAAPPQPEVSPASEEPADLLELDEDDFADDFVELSDEEVTLEAPPEIQPQQPVQPGAPMPQPHPAAPPTAPPGQMPQQAPPPPQPPGPQPPAPPQQPVPQQPPQQTPAAPAAPRPAEVAPAGGGVGGDGTVRVTLVGKVRGQKKLDAAELMSYYLGISQSEAVSQLAKTVVTVARDLTEEQAQECRERFAEIGVKVKLKG
jgi:hypothetical protein